MEQPRGPGQRAGLTRSAVLAAARDLLARGGLEALTMRGLARHLAVAPNALYSHVESKFELLDELLDDQLAQVAAPDPDVADPVAGLTELMTSTYAVLTANPDLVPLFVSRQGARGQNAVRLGVLMDGLLARAGVDQAAVAQARRVLIVHTIGSAAFATGAPLTAQDDRPLPAPEAERTFRLSLGWLLGGITRGTVPGEAATASGADQAR